MLSFDALPERRAAPVNYYLASVRLCEPSPPASILSLPICLPAPTIPAAAKLKAVSEQPTLWELAPDEVPFQIEEPEAPDLEKGVPRRGHQSYQEWLRMRSLWRRKYSEWPSNPLQPDRPEAERQRWWVGEDIHHRDEEEAMSCTTVRPQITEQFDEPDYGNGESSRMHVEEQSPISQQFDGIDSNNDANHTLLKRPRRADLVAQSHEYSRNSSSIIEIDLEGEPLASPSIQQEEHHVQTTVDHDAAIPPPFPRPPSPVHLLPQKPSPWTSLIDLSPRRGFRQLERNRRKETTSESTQPTKRRRELSSLVEQGWHFISLPLIRKEYWRYHVLNRTPLWLSGDDDDPETDLLLEVEPPTTDLEHLPFPNTTSNPPPARRRRKNITHGRLQILRAVRTLSTLFTHLLTKFRHSLNAIPKALTTIQSNLRRSALSYWRTHWSGYTIWLLLDECWTMTLQFTLPWIFAIQEAIITCLVIEFEGWYWRDPGD